MGKPAQRGGAQRSAQQQPGPPRRPQASLKASEITDPAPEIRETPHVEPPHDFSMRASDTGAPRAPRDTLQAYVDRELDLRERALAVQDAPTRDRMLEQADRIAEARDSLAAVVIAGGTTPEPVHDASLARHDLHAAKSAVRLPDADDADPPAPARRAPG